MENSYNNIDVIAYVKAKENFDFLLNAIITSDLDSIISVKTNLSKHYESSEFIEHLADLIVNNTNKLMRKDIRLTLKEKIRYERLSKYLDISVTSIISRLLNVSDETIREEHSVELLLFLQCEMNAMLVELSKISSLTSLTSNELILLSNIEIKLSTLMKYISIVYGRDY
ncbi:hypothetical protein KP803_11670 [Vibrio sp. ZSDE26]|uniref:Uncharacterized protein n=1 Tax=Vibrio amylolyticus TaxID=2847292 RepID=A0A9X1XL65_9VIBR|nr:hypothetical protein [Vibrio amylolyticus]MCK6263928.1 hypothetical protein [Vibrio amylolyticus]